MLTVKFLFNCWGYSSIKLIKVEPLMVMEPILYGHQSSDLIMELHRVRWWSESYYLYGFLLLWWQVHCYGLGVSACQIFNYVNYDGEMYCTSCGNLVTGSLQVSDTNKWVNKTKRSHIFLLSYIRLKNFASQCFINCILLSVFGTNTLSKVLEKVQNWTSFSNITTFWRGKLGWNSAKFL